MRRFGDRPWRAACSRRLRIGVVPVPPLIRRRLRMARRRVLPMLLAAKRREVQVAPGATHLLVAAVVDEVGAKDVLAVADEPIRALSLAMSACDPREANTSVVSRTFKWARWATWSAIREQPGQACSGQPCTPGSKNAR